jgi:spermidine synthase
VTQTHVVERCGAHHFGTRWLLPTLVSLFFLSGISALIYQVLWLRLLALTFGVTIYAASTVLASFMAGLALGSFVAGRLVDRAYNPLLWYGLAEVFVGLLALPTAAALAGIERLYATFYPALPHAFVPLTLVRFSFSFVILIVPTTLMGATLPIAVKSSLLRAEGLGQRVGLLYATNTAGAIVGTLLTGFYLIGGIGVDASLRLAAALNLLVGVAAVVASLAFKRQQAEAAGRLRATDPSNAAANSADIAVLERVRGLVLLVFALSGFASLALEVIWFRLLALFLEVTTYAFTVMLATFLCGIAAGSYLITPFMRRRLPRLELLAAVELAIGSASLFSLVALARVSAVLPWAEPLSGHPFVGEPVLMHAASFLAIFPTTLLMGVAFPVGMHLYAASNTDSATRSGQRVGLLYSLNVCGAIFGSVAAGFLLLPRLGSRGSLIAVAAISLTSGLLLLTALPRARRAWVTSAGAIGGALFLVAALSVPDPFAVVLAYRYPSEQLLWREEGVQTTVSVHQRPNGSRVLYLDGLHQANDSSGMIHVHRQIGHLPMALHHDPKAVLVIGLGGGATAGAVSTHAAVDVDVIELSEAVVRGSDWFRHVNHDVLRRPNVRLRIEDGRSYLLLTPKRYDVITADIIHPFHAGAGHLYAAEYFRLARGALKDDGLMLQWIPPGSETQYKLIMRTFLSVFPNTTLWASGSLMIGTNQRLQLDPTDFERKVQDTVTRAELASIGLESFQSLLGLYTAGPGELHRFVGPGQILSDDRPVVEYFLSLPRHDRRVDLTNLHGDVLGHVKR